MPYEIKRYERDKKTSLAPPELKQIHPLGKSPLITDGDHVVAESGAIVTYLIDKYGNGRLRPEAGSSARDRYEFWLHYAEGSLMPLLLLRLIFDRVRNGPVPFFIKPIARGIADKVEGAFTTPQLNLHMGYINDELGKSPWLAGDELSGADIQMSFPLEAGRTRAKFERYPNVIAFVDKFQARPAYKRALEKGGTYDYA